MKKITILLILFVFLFSALSIYSSSLFKSKPNVVKVQGTLSLVGSEPFTEVVLESNKIYYYLPQDFKKDYQEYYGFIVEVQGELQQKVLETVDHKYKITKNILTNVTIKKLSKRENY